ncbi:hypothetical protein EK21DRAFT_118197 [Setomelanomma holmii]|uniref:Uncharacterized protein n=1 Tax=Setomelanomma holmii TaxID=210430 RepID=A0A9P4LGY5_9PLEO|nr:hypothetical protein EK21DRAFT_118197 [Setomelanomma holmii]
MLALTGDSQNAQLTTVADYFTQVWPSYPDQLLKELHSLIFGPNERIPSDEEGISLLKIRYGHGKTAVVVSGSKEFVINVGQQLAWLGAVCTTALPGLSVCKTSGTCNYNDVSFNFAYGVFNFVATGTKPCWHRLIGSMAIVAGLPIPVRMGGERGLQIPVNIMAELGKVLVVDDFGSGVIFKGDVFDILPAERIGKSVMWHLVDSAANPLNYETPQPGRLGLDEFQLEDIQKTVAFLGWTPDVQNIVGTPNSKYADIEVSISDQPPRKIASWTSATGMLGLPKVGSVTAVITIAPRHYSQEVQKMENYDEILRDLRSRFVVLYDIQAQRGWLLVAERVMLGIILHRYESRNSVVPTDHWLKDEPYDIRDTMRKQAKTTLWKDVDVATGDEKDVYVAAEVKIIRTLLLKRSLESINHWRQRKDGLGSGATLLAGFDYRTFVETPANADTHECRLQSSCGTWPKDVYRRLGAIVMFGSNFQELLAPRLTIGLCPRYHTMPSGKGYLAAEASLIQEIVEAKKLSLRAAKYESNCPFVAKSEDHCFCYNIFAIEDYCPGPMDEHLKSLTNDKGAVIIGERKGKTLTRERDTQELGLDDASVASPISRAEPQFMSRLLGPPKTRVGRP